MRTRNKALLLTLCAVLLVTASVFGTVAYLSSTDSVNNTFTVGSVDISLDEAKVDEYGNVQGIDRVAANRYRLIPGRTYTKDPTVTVQKGSEKCYVRVLVSVGIDNKTLQDLYNVFAPHDLDVEDMVTLNTGWSYVTDYAAANGMDRVYEVRYDAAVDAREAEQKLTAVFSEFTASGLLDDEDIEALNGLHINVVAQAIQADGFADATAAWNAFEGK